jgi:hypothetical protein
LRKPRRLTPGLVEGEVVLVDPKSKQVVAVIVEH